MDGFEQGRSGGGLVQPVNVCAQCPGQQGGDVVVVQELDRHRNEAPPQGHGGRPLFPGPSFGFEVVPGEQGHHRVGLAESQIHLLDEVVTGAPVPPVQLDLVPGLLELPADPLRPGLVRACVAEKDTLRGVGHRCPRIP